MAETIEDLMAKTANVALATGDEISHADITARIPEVWAQIIESEADKLRIFRNFCKVNTDILAPKPGDTVKIPKHAVLDYDLYGPAAASELTPLAPKAELEYDTVTIVPVEVAISGAVTRQAIDEAMVSILDDLLFEMGKAMAQREDLDIIQAAVATTADEEITFVEANQDSDVYVSGKWTVAQAGALSLQTTTAGRPKRLLWATAQTNLTAGDVLDLGVITEAQDVLMEEQGYNADVLVIQPKQFADLKRNPQFIDASKAGDNSVLRTGQVGNFFGLNVYRSQNLPLLKCAADGNTRGYQALLIDTSRALALVLKRNITVETEYKPADRKHYIYITGFYKAQRLNDGAIIAINTT
jgi:N4-gp56 family major capsid protein